MEDLIIIAIIAVLVVFGLSKTRKHLKGQGDCCGGGSTPVKAKQKKLDNVIATRTMVIEGMTCEHCQARVEQSINAIDGVAAKVNLKKKEAVISLAADVSDETLRAAVEKAGYDVVEIRG